MKPELIQKVGLTKFIKWHGCLLWARVKCHLNLKNYNVLTGKELIDQRKSDTVFILGSGRSILDITEDEWEHFAEHDTMGFTGFVHQKWVRIDFHLIRGWVEDMAGETSWKNHTSNFADLLNNNRHFDNTTLILQGDYTASFANRLLGYGFIRPETKIFRYKTVRGMGAPTESLREGLRHAAGTLSDAVNLSYCMGYKHIVLVGVDLYNHGYFWLPEGKTENFDNQTKDLVASDQNLRGRKYEQIHSTAENGVVTMMGEWREIFTKSGVTISVYNPKSLMREVLPLYSTDGRINE